MGDITMLREDVIIENKTVTRHICDTCEKTETYRHCWICKQDVCRSCAIQTDWVYLKKGDYLGDSPGCNFCPECWELGKSFIERIKKGREALEKVEDQLVMEWSSFVKSVRDKP